MPCSAIGFMVIDRPRSRFRLERAEISFDFCQGPIGLEDRVEIPIGMAGAKDSGAHAEIAKFGRLIAAP